MTAACLHYPAANKNRKFAVKLGSSLVDCFVILAATAMLTFPLFAAEPSKPNIVVIVADDLGYADVLFNPLAPEGSHYAASRHAGEGKRDLPARLRDRSCVLPNPHRVNDRPVPAAAGTIYRGRSRLRRADEREACFRSSSNPRVTRRSRLANGILGRRRSGARRSAASTKSLAFSAAALTTTFKLDDPDDPIYRGTTPVKLNGYLTDLWGDEAVAFIERHKSQPFFLYLAFNAVHAPLQAPADEIARFNTGDYQPQHAPRDGQANG